MTSSPVVVGVATPVAAPPSRLARRGPAAVMVVTTFMFITGCDRGGEPAPGTPTNSAGTASAAPATAGIPVVVGTPPAASSVIEPVRLELPAIGVVASVRPVGIDAATKELSVPPSVDVVGWYRFGPGLESSAGSVVIAGHVDTADQGKGAFFRLRELTVGDQVAVTGQDGLRRSYTVSAREEWNKEMIPLERYFARDGATRLTLITCGGPFDEATRNYRDNIVITAVPA